ncbi:hypothetical protein SHAb15599_00007 [Acinetobacter phage SH-Ab 15599]|nr:hypothetical protein SHAb15599_00007 [Acinetobacter phage SH-Ab 15599]
MEMYDLTLPRWLNYCKAMVEVKDVDPVYDGLTGAKEEIGHEQLCNFLVSFSLFYSMEESCKIVSNKIPTVLMWDFMIEHYKYMKRGKARRYFRGQAGLDCLHYLKTHFVSPVQFVELMYAPDYKGIMRNFEPVPAFGGYHTWKWLDFYERVLGKPVELDYELGAKVLPSEPTKGARLVHLEMCPHKPFDLESILRYMVNECRELGLKAPPYDGRLVGIQEIETMLCGIVHMYKGKHVDYIGKDVAEKYLDVERIGEADNDWLLKHMPQPMSKELTFTDPYFNNTFSLMDIL